MVNYLFHVGGPHARGKPRAQDDGRKRKLRVKIYTFSPALALVTRYSYYYPFSTLKALRGFGDTAASVPDDFFCYFFSSLEKKVVLYLTNTIAATTLKPIFLTQSKLKVALLISQNNAT